MSDSVGTRAWALSGGSLRMRDRVQLVSQALLARLSLMPRRLRARLGLDESAASRIDPSTIRFPDSVAARRAGDLAESLSAPWLFNHCQRTYVWGAMLAQTERMEFDEEFLFVASALHDVGLIGKHNGKKPDCVCFAVEGARTAEKFSADIGWADERSQRLCEAISLHLNVRVGLRHGPEAHLLHAGAALDAIGARSKELHPTTIDSVLTQYPRLTFNQEMRAAMNAQARERPNSRAAFLVGLGIERMIRAAPLDDRRTSTKSLRVVDADHGD